jgi:hypothetical protein
MDQNSEAQEANKLAVQRPPMLPCKRLDLIFKTIIR